MNNLEIENAKLKDEVSEMINLVLFQLEKTRDCIINADADLAYDVVHTEMRVDVLELAIEKSCGNIIALLSPVASDMRFILSMLRLINDVERISDNCEAIAQIVIKDQLSPSRDVVEAVQIDVMFNMAITMLNTVFNSFLDEDSKEARKIFKMDLQLNQLAHDAPGKLNQLFNEGKISFLDGLNLNMITRKVERSGDLVKNVGESIIYHLEAKVLKHKETKKKFKE